jgi:sec-independent protein translocase protein TatA
MNAATRIGVREPRSQDRRPARLSPRRTKRPIINATLAKARKDDYLSIMTHALLGFGIGVPEIVIVLVIALLIFGPSKLPQLGAGVGKMLRGFKKEMKGMEEDEAKGESSSKAIDSDDKDEKKDEIDVTPKKESEKKTG